MFHNTKKATTKKHTRPPAPATTRNRSSAKHTRKTRSTQTDRAIRAAHLKRLRAKPRATNPTVPKRPPCPHTESLVIEVRRPKITRRGNTGQVRRRLECVSCKHRWTQYAPDDKRHRRPHRGATTLMPGI